jgi:hypothetical protein
MNLEKEIHEATELANPKENQNVESIVHKPSEQKRKKSENMILEGPINRRQSNSSISIENANKIHNKGRRKTSFNKSALSNYQNSYTDFLQNERHNFMMGDSIDKDHQLLFQNNDTFLNNRGTGNFKKILSNLIIKKKKMKNQKQKQKVHIKVPSQNELESQEKIQKKLKFKFSQEQTNNQRKSNIKFSSDKVNVGKAETKETPLKNFKKSNKKLNILKPSMKKKPIVKKHNRYSSISMMSVNSSLSKDSIFRFSEKNSYLDPNSLRDLTTSNQNLIDLEISDPFILIIDKVFEFNHFSCNNDYRNIHIANSEALIEGNDLNLEEYFSGGRKTKTKDHWFGKVFMISIKNKRCQEIFRVYHF